MRGDGTAHGRDRVHSHHQVRRDHRHRRHPRKRHRRDDGAISGADRPSRWRYMRRRKPRLHIRLRQVGGKGVRGRGRR